MFDQFLVIAQCIQPNVTPVALLRERSCPINERVDVAVPPKVAIGADAMNVDRIVVVRLAPDVFVFESNRPVAKHMFTGLDFELNAPLNLVQQKSIAEVWPYDHLSFGLQVPRRLVQFLNGGQIVRPASSNVHR